MAEDEDRRRWTQRRRFEFIEWKLFWEGQLNRADLEEHFGISTPQASVDLRNYRDIAESNLTYDGTKKAFLPSTSILPLFLKPSADRLLLQLRAWRTGALSRSDIWFRRLPPVDMVPDVTRHIDSGFLAEILRAMRTNKALLVSYQSLSSSRWRLIAPHALAFDGHRWHVRAMCCERGDFRDFVLTRIDQTGKFESVNFDPEDDIEWTTMVTLRLRPHFGLASAQRLAIERDFNMEDGHVDIATRASLAYYFIKRLNLDIDTLPPERAQVTLENLREVKAIIEDSRAASTSRMEQRVNR